MRIQLVSPTLKLARTGNHCTAFQWARILEGLGHCVVLTEPGDMLADADMLLALHATKCHSAIRAHSAQYPDKPRIVGLAGTDLYGGDAVKLQESMEVADHLVVLQHRALQRLPISLRGRARVISQSSIASAMEEPKPARDPFDVCVVGHLRPVKDPMRAAVASRLLPEDSRIRIRHAGAMLDESYKSRVDQEMRENARYTWLGELGGEEVVNLLAQCQLMVISSFSEGGARIIGEAIVQGTPVIGSEVDGVLGLLDEDYPGTFPVEDTRRLADLLQLCESDEVFLADLQQRTSSLAARFDPQVERDAWKALIDDCESALLGTRSL